MRTARNRPALRPVFFAFVPVFATLWQQRRYMEKLNDKWYRIIGIPLVALVSNIIFYYDMNDRHGFSFISDYAYNLVIAAILWEVNRKVIIHTRQRFPFYQQSQQRIIWTAAGLLATTSGIMTLISLYYDLTDWWGYDYKLKNYLYNNFAALTYVAIIGGIYEATYYFRKWNRIAVEAEMLKKENLQSQFESLKQQVNPHFLFNSLNTLSSLMRKDVDRAETFLNELSKVYRYLLRNNEDSLIELNTELQFVCSYFHLLQTRYGDAIQLKINIQERHRSFALPPLTLQLLIENAVKHNVIEEGTPLIIEIETEEKDRLLVRNNLQRKNLRFPSNRIGLTNISAKYKLLDQSDIQITETATDFVVQIPLIKQRAYANSDC